MIEPITFEITQHHIDACPAVHTYTNNPIYNAAAEQTELNILHVSSQNMRIDCGNFKLSPALSNMRRNPSLTRHCTVQITAIANHKRKVECNRDIPNTGHVDIIKYH